MSVTSTRDFDVLIDALEAAWIDPVAASDEEVESLLARRQEILGQIQSLDATSLSDGDKTHLHERMIQLHGRDQGLIAALHERMQNVGNQLGNAAQGRAAVRGYRAPEDAEAKLFIRPA